MSTIWEFLVERLKQCCEGSVTTETRGAQLATGFLASHLALRILTKVLKSLRLPFLRIQEAIMTIVSARAGMARTIMPNLRGGTSTSPMEGYKTSAEIAGKSRAARSARSKQTTVVLSLSVAGEISRVAGAHAAAAYSVLLPTLWRHDVRTVGGASLAAELPEATYHVRTARPSHSERDVKEKREAMTKAYPFAQNTIMGIG
ncbi:MAG: hypothetical protein QFX35_05075, partial [Candidatus Verstraetearchaeota archaeon]|nr:hypothetical protein [Candidatus Verstraetearchaeota archaeon]